MSNIFIFHGTKGSPDGNWFPWMKTELEKLGHNVFIPKFPTPENQSLQSWLDAYNQFINKISSDSIFIGHSLGCPFTLSLIERLNLPIKAAFLVAGFTGRLGNEEFDQLNDTFVNKDFDWKKITEKCQRFYVINSDNDPYVPIEQGKFIAQKLNTNLIEIKNGGHLNAEFGYTAFPELLELIKNVL